ncbi:hypothetical protein BGX34_003843 [Mortierella sp. NVP85]|nr:hypothetical protein BGX34_003843 [Mortierella sp. NVP85]
MEELQTQAAIQRDQFIANSARDPSGDIQDDSFHPHHSRPLPRFMMEPLDFLAPNYESCLEPGPDSNMGNPNPQPESSFQESFASMNVAQTSSPAVSSSIPTPTSVSVSVSNVQSTSIIAESSSPNPKKRPNPDDSHMFTEDHGLVTPPMVASNYEHLSPPTQDLFRLLMEELETQAAIQRDQVLASTRSDPSTTTTTTAEFSFSSTANNGHHHHHHQHHLHQDHHHSRLPRFALDPFDFLSDYGSMHDSNAQSTETKQDVFMGQIGSSHHTTAPATDSAATTQSAMPSMLPTHEGHSPMASQDMFRTLMEELETQAAFQRDQYLAATTGTAPRVDPEEYVFNGQHLRPLPRFMFEPLDFMTEGYESCLNGEFNHGNGSGSQQFDNAQNSLVDMGALSFSSNHPGPNGKTIRQLRGKTVKTSKYKAILPHRLEHPASSHHASVGHGRPSNPLKKRRLDDELDKPSCGSLSSSSSSSLSLSSSSSSSSLSLLSLSTSATSLPETVEGDSQESPVSPTASSALWTPPNTDQRTVDDGAASSPEGSIEGAGSATKRPWTPEEEQLLLKLFTKRTPIKEIARTLDRTVHSVRSRRQILTDPGFVKGKGHGVSRRCKADPATTTKLPTYAQMAFLSLAWLPDLEGTLNDVASMVEKLFSRHLNRIPRTGHKNLQIWRAQISDALAHEKGQPRPRFESFGLKRGRQWVYRLTEFGKGIVDAMGGVDAICQDLLRSNEMEMAASLGADDTNTVGTGHIGRDADGMLGGRSGADAGIGQGQGYGYSYRPPEARQKSGKRSRASRRAKKQAEAAANNSTNGSPVEGSANAIANAMEAMAAGLAKMMALEDEKLATAATR